VRRNFWSDAVRTCAFDAVLQRVNLRYAEFLPATGTAVQDPLFDLSLLDCQPTAHISDQSIHL
jgi:hypothetical protein